MTCMSGSPGAALELAPELVGAAEQRDVVRVLVVGEADDPRLAVHRPALVDEAELLEPEHAAAAAREVVQRGAAHRPDAGDDRVVAGRRSTVEALQQRDALVDQAVDLAAVDVRVRDAVGPAPLVLVEDLAERHALDEVESALSGR